MIWASDERPGPKIWVRFCLVVKVNNPRMDCKVCISSCCLRCSAKGSAAKLKVSPDDWPVLKTLYSLLSKYVTSVVFENRELN